MLEELYKKVVENTIRVENALDFIREAAKAINPTIPYNEQLTIAALQGGFLGSILPMVVNAVENNPEKVGFQVTKVYSTEDLNGSRKLLKIITKKL